MDLSLSLVSMLTALACVPLYLNYLTIGEYGAWLAISSLIAIVAFLDIGLDQSLINSAVDDAVFLDSTFVRHLETNLTIKFLIACIMLAIAALVALQIDSVVQLSSESRRMAGTALLVGVVNLIFGMYLSSFQSILFARKKFALNSLGVNMLAIGNSILPVVLLHYGFRILSFPVAVLLSTFISATIVISRASRKDMGLPTINPLKLISISSLRYGHIRPLARYTASFQLLKITSQLRNHALVLMMNSFFGPAINAQYALTSRLPAIASQFAAKVFQPFYPYIGESEYSGQRARTRDMMIGLTMMSTRIALYILLVLLFLNKQFVTLWVGEDKYIGDAANTFLIASSALAIALFNLGNFIYVTANFKSLGIVSVLETFFAIALGFLLKQYLDVAGVVISFAIASGFYFSYLTYHVFKTLDISLSEVARKTFGYAIPPNITTLCVLLYAYFFVLSFDWVSLSIVIIGSLFSQFITNEFWIFVKYRKRGARVLIANIFPFLLISNYRAEDSDKYGTPNA